MAEVLNHSRGRGNLNTHFRAALEKRWRQEEWIRRALVQVQMMPRWILGKSALELESRIVGNQTRTENKMTDGPTGGTRIAPISSEGK